MPALVRNVTANGRRKLESVRFVARDGAGAQLEQIGGTEEQQVLDRARAVERAVYSIGASLVPPAITDILSEARGIVYILPSIVGFVMIIQTGG